MLTCIHKLETTLRLPSIYSTRNHPDLFPAAKRKSPGSRAANPGSVDLANYAPAVMNWAAISPIM